MPETIAGVTLIAFANGAPDIFTAISATSDSEEGVFVSIGSLFGSTLFGTTIILARCIFLSKKTVKLQKFSWIRDMVFFIVGIMIVLAYGVVGEVNLLMAIGFFGLYFIYLVVVFVPMCYAYNRKRKLSYDDDFVIFLGFIKIG